jgi:N-acetylmuramoyl-L-alanine amidase
MPARFLGGIGAMWGRLAATLGAVLCLATAAAQGAGHGDSVVAVRLGGDSNATRIVLELQAPAKGKVIVASGAPDEPLILALPGVGVDSDMQGRGIGLVSAWTVDSAAGAARVRLVLSSPAQVRRRFLLPPSDGVSVYRYVIDLEPAAAPATAQVAAQTPTSLYVPQEPVAEPVSAPAPRAKKVIVIDPGHGGHDPGALGSDSREKDLNLAAARALKAKLERTGRYRVVMTRDSDVYVPLETRVEIARRANADLFISLHSDSGPNDGVRGATVYTLSDKGSERSIRGVTTDRNDWVIAAQLPGQTRAVNQILHDLTQRATRNRSAAFAEELVDHISERVQSRESHRDAGFMVLLAPDVPAVLLEMGFITNRQDEALLSNAVERDRFMGEVAQAIDAYFYQNTQIAAR